MNHITPVTTQKLGLALKQSEQALRNLRLAQFWARRQHREHLDQGIQDLAHRLAQLIVDVRSLISVILAQAQIDCENRHN